MDKTIFEQMGGTYTMQATIVCQILSYLVKKNAPSVYGDNAGCGT